jgi:hypothetical protein
VQILHLVVFSKSEDHFWRKEVKIVICEKDNLIMEKEEHIERLCRLLSQVTGKSGRSMKNSTSA